MVDFLINIKYMRVPKNMIPVGIHKLENPRPLPLLEIKYILLVEWPLRLIQEFQCFNEEAIVGRGLISNGIQSLDTQH